MWCRLVLLTIAVVRAKPTAFDLKVMEATKLLDKAVAVYSDTVLTLEEMHAKLNDRSFLVTWSDRDKLRDVIWHKTSAREHMTSTGLELYRVGQGMSENLCRLRNAVTSIQTAASGAIGKLDLLRNAISRVPPISVFFLETTFTLSTQWKEIADVASRLARATVTTQNRRLFKSKRKPATSRGIEHPLGNEIWEYVGKSNALLEKTIDIFVGDSGFAESYIPRRTIVGVFNVVLAARTDLWHSIGTYSVVSLENICDQFRPIADQVTEAMSSVLESVKASDEEKEASQKLIDEWVRHIALGDQLLEAKAELKEQVRAYQDAQEEDLINSLEISTTNTPQSKPRRVKVPPRIPDSGEPTVSEIPKTKTPTLESKVEDDGEVIANIPVSKISKPKQSAVFRGWSLMDKRLAVLPEQSVDKSDNVEENEMMSDLAIVEAIDNESYKCELEVTISTEAPVHTTEGRGNNVSAPLTEGLEMCSDEVEETPRVISPLAEGETESRSRDSMITPMSEVVGIVRPLSELMLTNMRLMTSDICERLRYLDNQCDHLAHSAIDTMTWESSIAFKRRICCALQVLEDMELTAVQFEQSAYSLPGIPVVQDRRQMDA